MTLQRRALLCSLLPPAATWLPTAARAQVGAVLPPAVSLQAEIAAAVRARKALLVMVSLHGCPFCRFARESHLAPLLRETGQPIVQVDMQSAQPVLDSQGRPTTHGALVQAWKVRAAPTVLFLGAGGRELVERLEGASIPDFYGAYLDERVAAANRAVA